MPFNDFGVTIYKLQKTLLQRYDSTRLVTVAMHPRYRNWETDSLPHPLAMITDVQAYNYRYMYFPGDGCRFPWMKFYQSEASTAAMGPNYFEMNLDRVIGLAYWGLIDYLGESQGWPAKGWANGVFDIALNPKPKAYLLKSIFKPEEPLVHIAIVNSNKSVMWNGIKTGGEDQIDTWHPNMGDTLNLITYTNANEVELLLNGKSLGRKQNPKNDAKQRNQLKWKGIKYANEKIEAIAYNNGRPVARHKIEPTGKAVKLIVTPDPIDWQADGQDLMHLHIQAVDAKGRLVSIAQNELQFSVDGDAKIVAVSNGDINSEEVNCTDHRRLWNGSALVILRAGQQPSKVTLKTKSDHFKTVITKLETK
jgi:beta-galactosidase